ncbi:MAG: SRPBCC family protein [Pedobacter sp.]|nr:SRPBCC family protein [Pedobacter sp.]
MMKILKVVGIIIAVLAVVILIGGMFLPKTYTVSRSTVINTSDSVIYKNIADFNEFYKWNPWAKMEPTAKIKISGPVGIADHLYEWEGNKTGSGYMKVKSVDPNKMVDMELKFIKPFESLADTRFDIAPDGTGNKVTWTMSGENNLMGKWMSVFVSMDKMIGKDFEDGLRFLKEKSESGK